MNNKYEKDLMAYLYGELEGQEKERFEKALLENAELRSELEKFQGLRRMMSRVEDKEVIAPPIVIGESNQRFLWNAPYVKLISSIAASLLIIMLVGKLTGTQVSYTNNEFKMSFGAPKEVVKEQANPGLSAEEVQRMINSSLTANNTEMKETLEQSQEKLQASIRANLASNSVKINELVRQASNASQSQIQQYVATMQSDNARLVKDYFALSATEQKKYVEDLLVDFAQYLQQQRNDDLQLVQTRLQSIEQNTNIFKQETEQILTSIIGTGPNAAGETKN